MKKLIIFIITVLVTFNVFAQVKSGSAQDVILKNNGEEMKGRVSQISDTEVRFIYSGETVEYIIKKSEIAKITYSSGIFNQY